MPNLIRSISPLPQEVMRGAISIGNFDGVHRGHRVLIENLRRLADSVGGPSVVFTFNPPPAQLLRPDRVPASLTWIERRAELLRLLGVDYVVPYPTDTKLLSLTDREFFQRVLLDEFQVKAIVEGPNFRFGKDRCGDVDTLKRMGLENGVQVEVVEPQMTEGEWVSSSRVREAIESGNIARANSMLVEPYRIRGNVGHGAARGRTIGFPTANLDNIPVLLPKHGVYAGRISGVSHTSSHLGQSPMNFPVAVNIGPNPTFGENTAKVEVHIIGYSGDLYDAVLDVDLLSWVRDVRKFNSKEELLEQLQRDVRESASVDFDRLHRAGTLDGGAL